ncbi:Serine/threonine protein phosphatase [Ostreococcus tauri]|uniref:Serine/threonine protein phosphatase n=1 Tax=Ostreococcus tauri TaxID=70448 RepID=A0A1Y5I301_OSTTA|nr:Serine/threonine protein phosphatase [Ostreococcus tauri]
MPDDGNACFRGCCRGTDAVRVDHVVRAASGPSSSDARVARGDVLYHGPLSTVFYGRFGARAIAIKRPKLRTTRELDRYHAELRMMLTLEHENVVRAVGASAKPPNYELFYEFMDNGAATEAMYAHGWTPTWQAVLRLAREVASGMAYLHRSGVVHRDVKPSNILLDRVWTAKIADFGLAERESDLRASLQHAIYSTEDAEGRARLAGKWIAGERGAPSGGFQKEHMVGSMLYMAPEVLMRRVSTYGADVYAYGITICEIATGTVPFSDPRAWGPDERSRPSIAALSEKIDAVIGTYCAERGLSDVSAVWLPPAASRSEQASAAEAVLREPLDWQTSECAFAPPTPEARKVAAEFTAGVFATAGARGADKMEDRHVIAHGVGGVPHAHLIAVFDGHRGHEAAEFAKAHVERAIQSEWGSHGDDIASALSAAVVKLDEAFCARFDAIKAKEMSLSKSTQQSARNPGCTAVVALVWGDRLCVANAGDCRAVLARADAPVALSVDHDAQSNESERARIERDFPGSLRQYEGVWRVGEVGVAVTRALGDADAKAHGVVAQPETVVVTLDPELDDALILACDGLWDVVSSEDAIGMIKDTVKEPSMCAKRLGSEALTRLSRDNVTVVVGFIRGARTCENVSWARAF